jgi:hypothetical protein
MQFTCKECGYPFSAVRTPGGFSTTIIDRMPPNDFSSLCRHRMTIPQLPYECASILETVKDAINAGIF